jgi:hypothetical protein
VLSLVVWQSYVRLPRVEAARVTCDRPPEQVARGLCARYEARHFDTQLAGWLWYDAGWYISIARYGYSDLEVRRFVEGRQSAVAFFPAYPLLVRQVNRLFNDPPLAAHLTTLTCGFGATMLFWRWMRDRLSRRARRFALACFLLYPYAWFLFGTGYGDALFLLVTLGAFVLVETEHPILAGLVAVPALAGRPTGVAVTIGLLAVTAARRDWLFVPACLRRSDAGVLLSLGGLVAWLAYLWARTDDPLAFVTVQAAWGQAPGVDTWFKARFVRYLMHSPPGVSLRLVAQAVAAGVFLGTVTAVWRRFGWGYAAYTFVIIVMPLVGTADFQGMGRYLLAAFPVFAVGGVFLDERPAWRWPVLAATGGLLVAFAALFATGHYLT